MSLFNNAIIGASGQQGYQISRSVRLRSSASAYFNRTPASATNRRTFTWSGWAKRGSLQTSYNQYFFSATPSASVRDGFIFNTSSGLSVFANDGSSAWLATTQVFRDPSAWYHIVVAVDTTQATSTNRIKVYVNGVQVTSFSTSTYPSQNYDWAVNNTVRHTIGDDAANAPTGLYHFDGYLAEINFIDGQALTPTSFGQFNSVTGVWQPLKYSGTYGTNGFYLNFSDNSGATATTIGKDYSGNGNNWTPNNISVTSGVTYDSMLDVPTPYADGGNGRGNYAVMNPLQSGSYVTQSNGNLTNTGNTATNSALVLASIGELTSGKWYWEYTQGTSGSETCGIVTTYTPGTSLINGENIGAYGIGARQNGTVFGGTVGSITSWTTGDVIGLAVDCDNGAIYWSKNGTWLNSGVPTSGASKTGAVGTWTPSAAKVTPAFGAYNGGSVSATFGQRPFAYTPPSGFKALNTQNLPAPTISNGATVMAATTYTGNGTYPTTITNGGNNTTGTTFQPDLVWMKARSIAYDNVLYDSVRGTGTGASLVSNSASAEGASAVNANMSAFASNGFTIGSTSSTNILNASGQTFVAWQWKAGGTTSSNTNGSITSTVSANATAGFSVVTYTGNGSTSATVGHGLGVVPNLVIVKGRSIGTAWIVKHSSLSSNNNLQLQSTAGQADASSAYADGGLANLTSSTVFSFLANGSSVNNCNYNTYTFVAYCFSAVAGYSAFGSYTGNGSSDGPFVYCGFRPRWLLVKRTNTTGDWELWDTARDTYNVAGYALLPNSSQAESYYAAVDILSNGFKFRDGSLSWNNSGSTYIFAAFAENPFKLSLAR